MEAYERRRRQIIYFIQAKTPDGRGPIKIGYTASTAPSDRRRIDDLQTGCPYELVVLRFLPGTRREEKALHKRFADFRMRGEWFEYTPGLAAFILRFSSVDEMIHWDPSEHEPAPVVDLRTRRAVS